jgi:hypothetical protein
MQFYGLSPQRILGIISRPKRKEEGIVKNTIAVMKPVSPKIVDGKETWKQEIWTMYQLRSRQNPANPLVPSGRSPLERGKRNAQVRVISAWRYPGVSPERNPIPEEILREVANVV